MSNIVERADRIAEYPVLKLVARGTMIAVTAFAIPYIYWMTNQMITTVTIVGSIVTIQTQQQGQIAKMVETQTRLLDLSATEAQARATQDAAFSVQIQALKEQASRIDEHLNHTDDRLNSLFRR